MSRMSKPSRVKIQELEVENWNLKHPVGKKVKVELDNGSWIETTTNAPASMLGGHTAVAWLNGISGCYRLSRVRPIE